MNIRQRIDRSTVLRRQLDPRLQVIPSKELRDNWYSTFRQHWSHCTRCPLAVNRTHVVQFRGIIPAAVLFIGEAPGQTEDENGIPFTGPAGRKLDEILNGIGCYDGLYAIINTVACIPCETTESGILTGKTRPPEKAELKACKPRVLELVQVINPRLIVLLGKIAASVTLPPDVPVLKLVHPAYILQLKSDQKAAIETQRFRLTLKDKLSAMELI